MLHILFSFPLWMEKLFYYKLNLHKDKMNAVLLIQYMSSTSTSLALGVWHQICPTAFANSDCKTKLLLAVLSTGWAHSDYITVDFFFKYKIFSIISSIRLHKMFLWSDLFRLPLIHIPSCLYAASLVPSGNLALPMISLITFLFYQLTALFYSFCLLIYEWSVCGETPQKKTSWYWIHRHY